MLFAANCNVSFQRILNLLFHFIDFFFHKDHISCKKNQNENVKSNNYEFKVPEWRNAFMNRKYWVHPKGLDLGAVPAI